MLLRSGLLLSRRLFRCVSPLSALMSVIEFDVEPEVI